MSEKDISAEARKAAELEIAANELRRANSCDAPLGVFVQEAINKAREELVNQTARG